MSPSLRRTAVAAVLAVSAVSAVLALSTACARQEQADKGATPADSAPVVVLETSMGRIVMQFDRAKAPRAVDNIVRHLGISFYDGLTFHRVIAGFMIQTGMTTPDGMVRTSSAPSVPIESDNGLKNLRGTVGLARMNDPNSGGVQFYINVVDNADLDFKSRTPTGWGYTVLGRVTEGMDVADRISRVATTTVMGARDVPVEPIIVQRAFVQRPDSAAATAAPAAATPPSR